MIPASGPKQAMRFGGARVSSNLKKAGGMNHPTGLLV